MPDERIGCRKFLRRRVEGVDVCSGRVTVVIRRHRMAEKSEGGAITMPVKPSPWFARLRDGRRSLQTDDWPRG
jgi:hypothetical protein